MAKKILIGMLTFTDNKTKYGKKEGLETRAKPFLVFGIYKMKQEGKGKNIEKELM